MIPTMIVFGLVLGRWWRTALLAGALLWPALLLATHVIAFDASVLGAALLGAVNVGVGVGLHQGAAWAVRTLHARRARTAEIP